MLNINDEIMLESLSRIDSLIDKSNAIVVIDSGSLLGIYREKGFLSHESEIDISMSDHDAFIRIIANLKDIDFTLWKYKGKPYKCWFQVEIRSKKITIDLKLFSEEKDCWSSPAIGKRSSPVDAETREKSGLSITTKFLRKIKPHIDFGYFPLSPIMFHDAWVVPDDFFQTTLPLNNYKNIHVPNDIESYLNYRYHNWLEPKTDWVSHRDDGGFRKSTMFWPRRVRCKIEKTASFLIKKLTRS